MLLGNGNIQHLIDSKKILKWSGKNHYRYLSVVFSFVCLNSPGSDWDHATINMELSHYGDTSLQLWPETKCNL